MKAVGGNGPCLIIEGRMKCITFFKAKPYTFMIIISSCNLRGISYINPQKKNKGNREAGDPEFIHQKAYEKKMWNRDDDIQTRKPNPIMNSPTMKFHCNSQSLR